MTNPLAAKNDAGMTEGELVFQAVDGSRSTIEELIRRYQSWIYNFIENRCIELFRDHYFENSPDFVESFRNLISTDEFAKLFNLHN